MEGVGALRQHVHSLALLEVFQADSAARVLHLLLQLTLVLDVFLHNLGVWLSMLGEGGRGNFEPFEVGVLAANRFGSLLIVLHNNIDPLSILIDHMPMIVVLNPITWHDQLTLVHVAQNNPNAHEERHKLHVKVPMPVLKQASAANHLCKVNNGQAKSKCVEKTAAEMYFVDVG